MSDVPPQLEYAPSAPRARRWRRVARIAAWLVVAVVAITVSWKTLQWHAARMRILRLQKQCLTYVVPTLDHDSNGLFTLVVSKTGYKWEGRGSVLPWTSLYSEIARSGMRTVATVFVHERASGSRRRIVGVDLVQAPTGGSGAASTMTFCWRVIEPGNYTGLPRELRNGTTPIALPPNVKRLVINAGTFDPADPTHFTFDYEVNEQNVVVDGYLKYDDTVVLLSRAPTTASTSRPSTLP